MKFPNPKNPNNKLINRHCFYVGTSGSGKTSAVKNLPFEKRLQKSNDMIFFDPFGDYQGIFKGEKVEYFSTKSAFYRAVLVARRKKKPVRVAYQPSTITYEEIDFFCGVCWSVADGKRPLHMIIEEVAQFVTSTGNAKGYLNNVISVGRKFGLMCSFIFQRGQAIPKTLISNCAYAWVGAQSRAKDAVYLSEELGIDKNDILQLKKLEYIFKKEGEKHKKGVIKF